jgi:hypothetical protein
VRRNEVWPFSLKQGISEGSIKKLAGANSKRDGRTEADIARLKRRLGVSAGAGRSVIVLPLVQGRRQGKGKLLGPCPEPARAGRTSGKSNRRGAKAQRIATGRGSASVFLSVSAIQQHTFSSLVQGRRQGKKKIIGTLPEPARAGRTSGKSNRRGARAQRIATGRKSASVFLRVSAVQQHTFFPGAGNWAGKNSKNGRC